MISHDYTQLSNDALLQKFIDAAKATGNVFALDINTLKTLDERKLLNVVASLGARHTDTRIQELHALGAELRRRKPVAEVRRLFEHDDRDVRGWAGAQLRSIDPERADAAISGLTNDLSTQEVLALRRRILQRPSPGPALREMTVIQLVDCFIDACERRYGSTRFLTEEEGGWPTMKAYNKISEDYGAARELNRRSELHALLPLFDHVLITVRLRVARYCLPITTERAIAILEQIAATWELPERMDALRTLGYWRDGQYCAFPDDPNDVRL